jgi:hypothetical protein
LLKVAILEGISCVLDETEYDLHEDSHPLFFSDSHSRLLEQQSKIGWEYFLKGFIVKEWGYIQGQYYLSRDLNQMKYNSKR